MYGDVGALRSPGVTPVTILRRPRAPDDANKTLRDTQDTNMPRLLYTSRQTLMIITTWSGVDDGNPSFLLITFMKQGDMLHRIDHPIYIVHTEERILEDLFVGQKLIS